MRFISFNLEVYSVALTGTRLVSREGKGSCGSEGQYESILGATWAWPGGQSNPLCSGDRFLNVSCHLFSGRASLFRTVGCFLTSFSKTFPGKEWTETGTLPGTTNGMWLSPSHFLFLFLCGPHRGLASLHFLACIPVPSFPLTFTGCGHFGTSS